MPMDSAIKCYDDFFLLSPEHCMKPHVSFGIYFMPTVDPTEPGDKVILLRSSFAEKYCSTSLQGGKATGQVRHFQCVDYIV